MEAVVGAGAMLVLGVVDARTVAIATVDTTDDTSHHLLVRVEHPALADVGFDVFKIYHSL